MQYAPIIQGLKCLMNVLRFMFNERFGLLLQPHFGLRVGVDFSLKNPAQCRSERPEALGHIEQRSVNLLVDVQRSVNLSVTREDCCRVGLFWLFASKIFSNRRYHLLSEQPEQ